MVNVNNKAIISILALILIAAAPAAVSAAGPLPAPNDHNAAILDLVPELAGMAAPTWLMTGYRFFYDVLYYDKDDEVIDSALLVFDIVGTAEDHVLTNCYVARFDDRWLLSEFKQYSYMVDYPAIGEVWISPDAIGDEDAPGVKSGIFQLVVYTTPSGVNEDGMAWYTMVTSQDGLTDTEIYYNHDGLLLGLDSYAYDEKDQYIGGTAVTFNKYAEYSAPWLDFGFSGLEEGISLVYDMKVVWTDGRSASGEMSFVAEENHFNWVYLSQFLKSAELGDDLGDRIVSEMSMDGLMLWMDPSAMSYITTGDVYYDEPELGSLIKADAEVDIAGFGKTRLLHFKDGFFMADSYFGKDGYLALYYQYPNEEKPFEIYLQLREVK